MKKSIIIFLIFLLVTIPSQTLAAADIEPPVTSIVINGNVGSNGIYYGAVQVEITGYDSGSGISNTQYSLNGGTWVNYANPIKISESAAYSISYRSTDKSGNVESPKTKKFSVKSDTTAPATSIQVQGQLGQNSYYIGTVRIILTAIDYQSGVDYTQYSLDNGKTWIKYMEPFDINNSKNNVVYYRSIDKSGNVEKSKKTKVSLDITPPASPSIIFNPSEWTNSDVTVTLNHGLDEESGVKKTQYRLNETSNWIDYTDSFVVDNPGQVVFARSIDYAGNISGVSSDTVQIDRIAPTSPEIVLGYDDWTNEETSFYIRGGSDNESQLRRLEYKINDQESWEVYMGPESINEEGINKINARSVDWAGNNSSEVVSYIKIDKTPPESPTGITTTEKNQNDISISWIVSVDNFGIKQYYVYQNDVLIGVTTDTNYKFNNLEPHTTYQFTIVSEDLAGNLSDAGEYSEKTLFVPHVYAGSSFGTIKSDGTVWMWGSNSSGQLGNPYVNGFSRMVKVEGISDVVELAIGLAHTIALKEDGTVWAWGNNTQGQLGDNTFVSKSYPVRVSGLDSITSISAGSNHNLALKSDGTLWGWGSNSYGQLALQPSITGNDKRSVPLSIVMQQKVKQIGAGSDFNAVLLEDGSLLTWGKNTEKQLGRVSNQSNSINDYTSNYVVTTHFDKFVSLSVGANHTIAMSTKGELWGWGDNQYEVLTGPAIKDTFPILIQLDKSIIPNLTSASGIVTILYDNNDNIFFKNNYFGTSIPVKKNEIKEIVVSSGRAIFLKNDNSIWDFTYDLKTVKIVEDTAPTVTWSNLSSNYLSPTILSDKQFRWDQLDGYYTKFTRYRMELLNDNNEVVLDTGEIAMDTTSSVMSHTITSELPKNQTLKARVKVKDEQSWSEWSPFGYLSLPLLQDPLAFAGSSDSYWVKSDGSLWGWGSVPNAASITSYKIPTKINDIDNVKMMDSSGSHVLVLKNDGTVWAWGKNNYGQLGDGTLTGRSQPMKIEGLPSIVSVSAGIDFSIAVASDGTIWAWGKNNIGQLGLGNLVDYKIPTKGLLSNVKKVVSGYDFSAALTTAGEVYVWGDNTFYQLGGSYNTTNGKPYKSYPTLMVYPKDLLPRKDFIGYGNVLTNAIAIDIAVGPYSALVLKNDNTVIGWGRNESKQLYSNASFDVLNPLALKDNNGQVINAVKSIAIGTSFSMFLKQNGTVVTQGFNPTSTSQPYRVVSITNVKSISMTWAHSLMIKNDGSLWAMGSNVYYQIGNGSTVYAVEPINIKE